WAGATLPESPASITLSGQNGLIISGSAPAACVCGKREPWAHGSGHTDGSSIRGAAGAGESRSYTPWHMASLGIPHERIKAMPYMVEFWATIERGDTVDKGEGPGPIFAKIVERFHPQALYGDPTRRHLFMVVELENPATVAELMYTLTWFTGNEPKFTPIM